MTVLVIMATGWTWEYVWETMTFQRLEVFARIWKHSPPPHKSLGRISLMLQKFLGFKDGSEEPESNAHLLATMPDVED